MSWLRARLSLKRHLLYFVSKVKAFKPKKSGILDVGCGFGATDSAENYGASGPRLGSTPC